MKAFETGLRCQDVHAGLRNVDPNSVTPLADTSLIGMAATLAAFIRGRDVVDDAQALRAVAADQLDVAPFAFKEVVTLLEEVGFVQGVRQEGGKVLAFTESVPFYTNLYDRLGQAWQERHPSDFEQQMVLVVDALAKTPVPVEDLVSRFGLATDDLAQLLHVGQESHLIERLEVPDGEIAYSPFFGFEQPRVLADLVVAHGSDRLAVEFDRVREMQGLPINPADYPLLTDAVGRGLVMAPAVELPDGQQQPFAAVPYVIDQQLLTVSKPVVDKALAVLACLRCAQSFGGYNNLTPTALIHVIDKLLDPNRGMLQPHSAHRRQYQLIYRAGIIKFDPDPMPGGSWVVPRFIDTEDNRTALQVARDLIIHGEIVSGRIQDEQASQMLASDAKFFAPMQTIARKRPRVKNAGKHWEQVFAVAMGHSAL